VEKAPVLTAEDPAERKRISLRFGVVGTFELRWHYGDDGGVYQGPWEVAYGREVDPSNLLRTTGRESYRPHKNNWWFPIKIASWREEEDHVRWLKRLDDLPDPRLTRSRVSWARRPLVDVDRTLPVGTIYASE
jgi:hypothetical protein